MFTAIVLETIFSVTFELSRLVPILSQVQRSILPNFVTHECAHTQRKEREQTSKSYLLHLHLNVVTLN